jgi:clan AA aspartic protease
VITGTVVNRRAIVPLVVQGPTGQEATVEAHLDSGFNGFLTLPSSAVAVFSLPFANYFRAGLADGSVVQLAVHRGSVIWDGVECIVDVLVAERQPLLGTALLDGHELVIRFAEGDRVTIQLL